MTDLDTEYKRHRGKEVFEDPALKQIVTDSVTEIQDKEQRLRDDFAEFQRMEKENKPAEEMKPIEYIDNRLIMNSISSLNLTFTQFVANQTVEIHAEAIEENMIIKKLSSIKGDTLRLNTKNFKLRVLEYLLFMFIGVSIGLLDNVWMPHLEGLGSILKPLVKLW